MDDVAPTATTAFEDPLEESDFQAARAQLLHPKVDAQKTRLLVISVIAFVSLSLRDRSGGMSSFEPLAMLVGVLFVHELGHAVAMHLVGYRDVKIFFIPLLGAATTGRKRGAARWKEGLVLLMGPMPGIVAGAVLAMVGGSPEVHKLALYLVVLNGLNLLPISLLDGGQLFRVVLFSRWSSLEVWFVGVTGALLVAAAVWSHLWVLVFFGALSVLTLPNQRRMIEAARALRGQLPPDPEALDDAQMRTLYRAAWRQLAPPAKVAFRGKPIPQAAVMTQLLDRTRVAPSWAMTGGVFAVWAVGLAIASVAVVSLRNAPMPLYTSEAGGFAMRFPGRLGPNTIKDRSVGGKIGDYTYMVIWNTEGVHDRSWLDSASTGLLKNRDLIRDVLTPLNERELVLRDRDRGAAPFHIVRLVAGNGRGYIVEADGPDETDRMHEFVDSFKLVGP